jgi:undecaprenyl-diphosphatase
MIPHPHAFRLPSLLRRLGLGATASARLAAILKRWRVRFAAELGTAIGIATVAAALLAFFGILDEVVEGEAHAVDERILLLLRNPADTADPIGPPWLEEMVRDVTALGGTAVLTLVTLVVVGYLLMQRQRGAALWVIVAILGGTLVSLGLKGVFDRPRPDLVAHLAAAQGASFPSGHAMLSAVAYLTLGALLARLERRRRAKIYVVSVALALTLLVGASRVYLGVHWPTDVLAGWCVGAAWAGVCWLATLWLQRRGQVEPPAGAGAEPSAAPRV